MSFAATIKPHPENQLSVSDFIHFQGSVMIGGPFVVSSMYIRALPSKIWGIQSTRILVITKYMIAAQQCWYNHPGVDQNLKPIDDADSLFL